MASGKIARSISSAKPTSRNWQRASQRRVARSLIEPIVVSPPVAGGTIEDRFHVLSAHGG
jgi:hypothetical protein